MRLSNAESSDALNELVATFSEKNFDIEAPLQMIPEIIIPDMRLSSRKGSDILLGEDFTKGETESIIISYFDDIIQKQPCLSVRRRNEAYINYLNISNIASSGSSPDSYMMKTKRGLKKKLEFVNNTIHHKYYTFFDSQMDGFGTPRIKQSVSGKQISLHEIHIEPRMSLLTRPKNSFRRPKRYDFNSKEAPQNFFPDFLIQHTSPIISVNSTSVRRSPMKFTSRPTNQISPFLVKVTSVSSLSMDELDLPISEADNHQNEKKYLEPELELQNSGISDDSVSCILKRQCSADLFTRKRILQNRESLGNFSTKLDTSFDLDDHDHLKRVNSALIKKPRQRLTQQLIPNNRPEARFKVLEQKEKKDSTMSMLIIFNETTTLKIRLEVCGVDEDIASSFGEISEGKKSSKNDSNSSLGEILLEGNGRYRITKFKSLMFAKDPIRNELFEHTLKFVEKNFWYDTLHRFLVTVDKVYTDLTQYYSKVLRELSATNSAARIENNQNIKYLAVEGQVKSARLTFATPLIHHLFTVEAKSEKEFALLPMTSNKKLPNKGLHSELSCNTVDSLIAYKYFVSSFA